MSGTSGAPSPTIKTSKIAKKGAVKKVPKKKGCDLAKKQDSSLFLWYN